MAASLVSVMLVLLLLKKAKSDQLSNCEELVASDQVNGKKGLIDGFELTVSCNGSRAELEWLNKLNNDIRLVNIEYSFYNLTSGYNYTQTVSAFSEQLNGLVQIDDLSSISWYDTYYVFRCCFQHISIFNIYSWTMNTQTVNCTFKDLIKSDSLPNKQLHSHSSTATLLLSPVKASLTTSAVETNTIVTSTQSSSLVTDTSAAITSLIKTTDVSTTMSTAVAQSTADPMLNGFNDKPADILWAILLLLIVIIVVIGTITTTGIALLLFNRKMVLNRMATLQRKHFSG